MTTTKLAIGSFVAAWIAFAAPVVNASTPTYHVLDFGTLPGDTTSLAWGINASGQVAGYSSSSTDHAFETAPNGPITAASTLGSLSGTLSSYAYGINGSGQVVGTGR